ncbi:MAG: hypothetical protein PHH47_05310 [Gallionella sp.]|nr:hypothetical protein [Gallionella sp.]MDD4945500.1 hypothetical protein [Gallionella sp.]
MKINKTIRSLYQEQYAINKLLETRVKEIFEGKKKAQWFFLCRIKGEESFALKLETGRVHQPEAMEDFFACTLVVENRTSIAEALNLVSEVCDIVKRRPPADERTHKSPEEFSFDDLRLYVKLKSGEDLPSRPLDEIVFEVQIKTFLQHAWGVATHDLVYKGKSVHWGRARVAFQIKAMLEHAEISVERVDAIAESSLLNVTDEKIRKLKTVIDWLQKTWAEELLPEDMVRLAENILSIAHALKLDIEEIINCVGIDTAQGQGAQLYDLTPFAVVIRSIYNHRKSSLERYLCNEGGKFRIFFADDPELLGKVALLNGVKPSKFIALGDIEAKSQQTANGVEPGRLG